MNQLANPSLQFFNAVQERDIKKCRHLLEDLSAQHRRTGCRNVIEAIPHSITPGSLRTLIMVDPSLLCTDTAEILLNSGNLQAVDRLVALGWDPTQDVADRITSCIDGASEDLPNGIENEELRSYYQPIVDWIRQKGLQITL